jgi:hypothetical protein
VQLTTHLEPEINKTGALAKGSHFLAEPLPKSV